VGEPRPYAVAMATPMTLTALYEPVEDGWVQARVRELPSVITAAPTRAHARTMLEDAVREYLLAMLEPGSAGEVTADVESETLAVTIGD
jgi:predicted RNase H-like HicB family nuclease